MKTADILYIYMEGILVLLLIEELDHTEKSLLEV